MRNSPSAYPLDVAPRYPGNGLPSRPGEDRPGLSPFGRLAMGQVLGKSSILVYDHHLQDVQTAPVDMISIVGDDLDAQQLILTLHPPRVIPLSFTEISDRLSQQNLTGEQTNSEVTTCDFPGSHSSIRWPPLEALIQFGVGGVSTTVVVDYINGITLSVSASFLRAQAIVTQNRHCGGISGTSAAYHLAAHVGPGFAESHAQRTVFLGDIDGHSESLVFDIPRFAKVATISSCRKNSSKLPVRAAGWIRFWQDPKGTHGAGEALISAHQLPIKVPNSAQYFTVSNASKHEMTMAVVFELAL